MVFRGAGCPHCPGAHSGQFTQGPEAGDQPATWACFLGQLPRSALPTDSKSRTGSADAHGPAWQPRGLDCAGQLSACPWRPTGQGRLS